MPKPDNVSENVLAAVESVLAKAAAAQLEQPGLNLWVTEVLSRFSGVAARVAPGNTVNTLRTEAERALASGDYGEQLGADKALESAVALAAARGSEQAVARDLVAVILEEAGLDPSAQPAPTEAPAVSPDESRAPDSPAGATAAATAADAPDARPTPTLDRFGRDLTEEARTGKVHPAVGRDSETETLIEVLCRTQKRNPLLMGPAGCGKTAIVESFACRVAAGDVPALLRGVRVMAVQTSTLLGGTSMAGSFEERIQKIIAEASQPGVILFIDEAHSVAGAGGRGNGMADAFKPALARGSLALIAATTDDEYRQYIKPDRALERRFQPVPIAELGPAATLEIVRARRDRLLEERNVQVADEILEDLVAFAEENLRNRTFPDKALDLLEQCVAFAVANGLESIDTQDMTRVLTRMLGMTIAPAEATVRVADELAAAGVDDADAQRVLRRLTTTLNGLDLRASRPNLVLAMTGEAGVQSGALARAFARALYGADERVVNVDLSQIQDDAAISVLVGSMPGYVGYGRKLPIHELEVTPRTVVVVTGADVCHPLAAEIVAKGFADGFIADTTGTRYFLSDAIVLLPASRPSTGKKRSPLGFVPSGAEDENGSDVDRGSLEGAFGGSLTDQIDVHLSRVGEQQAHAHTAAISQRLLPEMAAQYSRRGISLTWDESVVAHLAAESATCSSSTEVERLAEEWVSNLVMPAIRASAAGGNRRVRLTVVDGEAQVAVE